MTNREMTVITDIPADKVTEYSSGTLSAIDSAGSADPIDFGTVSATGVTREVLGSGYVYKTTRAYRRLYVGTNATYSATGSAVARTAPTAPTTTNLTTHGTQMWSTTIPYNSAPVSGAAVLSDVPADSYFWFYPTTNSTNVTNRLLELRGTDATAGTSSYVATHTVGAYETVAAGNLKYDVTNETSVTDIAGNAMPTRAATTIANTVIDTTMPILTATDSGTTLTVKASESVYAATTPDLGDFAISSGETLSSLAGLASTAATADNSFTMTLSGALTGTPTLSYAQNATDGKRIKDKAGTAAASAAGITIGKSVLIYDVANDNYINADEDDSAVLIAGFSGGLVSGTTVTVTVDDADADSVADHTFTTTVDANGAWTTSSNNLTSSRVRALDEGVMTITASATGAVSGVRTVVYDATAPTATVQSVSGGYVDAAEDGSAVPVFATGNEDLGSVQFSITDGTDTLVQDGVEGGAAYYTEKLSDAMSALSFADADHFGWSIARDGVWLAVGAYGDNTGGTDRGVVYLIKDGDGDGRWDDATSSDVIEINGSTAGVTLADSDLFGSSVALGDGLLIVGAYQDDTGGVNRGAVYLIDDGGNDWADIVAGDVTKVDSNVAGITLANGDHFGRSVARDGLWLAVGANGDNSLSYTNSGQVHLIKDGDGDGRWDDATSNDVITIDDSTAGISLEDYDLFGISVALDDGLLAVGVRGDDTGGTDYGAVYLIDDGGNDWADIIAGDVIKIDNDTAGVSLTTQAYFGAALAIDDGLLAVGAYGDGESLGSAIGAAYLIKDGGDGWSSILADDVTKIDDSTSGIAIATSDNFGTGIALDGGLLLVGTPNDDTGGTNYGAVYVLDVAYGATLATGDFEGDGVPTAGDGKLAAGAVTVTATPTDVAGNTGTGATGSFVYDPVVPTMTDAYFDGTTVVLTMSEPVWAATAPAATDFKVSDDGTDITVSGAVVAATRASASETIVLTVPTIAASSVVKAWYTKGTNAVEDAAGNEVASLASGSALTAAEAPTVSFAPANGDYLTTLSGNLTIDFSEAVYSDSACATALTNATAATITDLREDDGSGTAIGHAVTYDSTTHTITLNPSANLSDGAVYVALTDGWYQNASGTCAQGYASAATVTVDATAPTATLTGAPSGTNNTTTLAVSVGGTDVTHYKSAVGAGASCPSGTYSAAKRALISSGIGITDSGLTATATRLYVVKSADNQTIRAYDRETGARVTSEDITLAADNDNASGMHTDGTTIWVTDNSDDKVYAYTLSTGARDTSKEFSLDAANSNADGIVKIGTSFYVADGSASGTVYVYNSSGTKTADFSTFGYPNALTTDGTNLVTISGTTVRVYTTSGTAVTTSPLSSKELGFNSYSGYFGGVIYDNTLYVLNPTGSIQYIGDYGAETAVATNITDDISSLADGSVSLCVKGRDAAGNYQSTPTTTTWTKDATAPTISGAYYDGTTVTLTMSEPVWAATAPAATDFKASDDGTDITVSAAVVAATAATASETITLTVPTIAASSVVKVWYTKGTNAVEDGVGNDLASLASGSAVTATEAVTITIAPANGGYLTSLSGNLTIDFSAAVYSDSGCTTALTNTTAGTITDLQEDDSDGTTVAHAATYNSTTHTITLNPSSNLTEGDVVYVSLTNGWYDNSSGTCTQGYASDATVTVDATAPTATLTGAPTGTNNTTTLAVTVGGTDVTHYKSVVAAGASCPTGTVYDGTEGQFVGTVGQDSGLAATATRLYTVFSDSTKVKAYNRTTGAAVTTDDITLHSSNTAPAGLATDGTTLWVLDWSGAKVYAYTLSTGAQDTSKEFTLHSDNAHSGGITLYDSHFYVVDTSDSKVYAYTTGGSRVTAKEFTVSASMDSITNNGAHFFLEDQANRKFDAYTIAGTRDSGFDITGLLADNTYYTFGGAAIYGTTFYYTKSDSVRYKTGTANAVPYGSEAAVATNITTDISSVADGTVTLCVAGRDAAGNYQSTPTTTSWTKDATAPTIADVLFNGTTVMIRMSEPVWGDATKADFAVSTSTDGSNWVTRPDSQESSFALASSAATASDSITLVLTTPITTGTQVRLQYSAGGSRYVKDVSGNALAASVTQSSAEAPTITFAPADGGYLTALAGNFTIDFSAAVYSENSCTTALTNTTAATITDLREDDGSGTAIGHAATYNSTTHTITLNPSSNVAEGDVAYVSLTDGWYFADGASCVQGYASDATVTVDAAAPTAVLTGAPSGTDNTTTLAVTVGGTGVTHYKSAVAAGASCPSGTFSGAQTVFIPSGITNSDSGIAATATRLYVANSDADSTIRVYNRATGARVTADDITPAADNDDIESLYTDGTTLWALDEDDTKVYAYTISTKAQDTSKEFTLDSANTYPGGLMKVGTSYYVYDWNSGRMYVYNASGTKTSDFYLTTGFTDIASYNNKLYTISSGIGVRTLTGTIQSTISLTSGNSYYGLYVYDNTIYVLSSSGSVDTIGDYGGETAVGTNITTDISSLADGTVALCVVGRDVAGNYQSTPTTTTWTKDATAPTISSGHYNGTSVVLTMSEPVYGSLTAGDFKVDDDGTDLTASTVLMAGNKNNASATVSLTMPSAIITGSAAKVFYTQGTNRVKDVAGNELATLAEASGVDACREECRGVCGVY